MIIKQVCLENTNIFLGDEKWYADFPSGGQIIDVHYDEDDYLYFSVLCDPEAELNKTEFYVTQYGMYLDEDLDLDSYIGSVMYNRDHYSDWWVRLFIYSRQKDL